jgi:Concanavalin A-like lectin/glucanases superfamily
VLAKSHGFPSASQVGTCNKEAGAKNQRLCLNGTRVAQMSDTLPIDLNSAAVSIGRHVSGIADPFNAHIDEFRISHIQRSDGWIGTTWNNMNDPAAFAVAGPRSRTAASRHRWPALGWSSASWRDGGRNRGGPVKFSDG